MSEFEETEADTLMKLTQQARSRGRRVFELDGVFYLCTGDDSAPYEVGPELVTTPGGLLATLVILGAKSWFTTEHMRQLISHVSLARGFETPGLDVSPHDLADLSATFGRSPF
jgi:hypothetical protein